MVYEIRSVFTIDPQMRSVGFMLYRGHPIHS
jgi:hypothetical protein